MGEHARRTAPLRWCLAVLALKTQESSSATINVEKRNFLVLTLLIALGFSSQGYYPLSWFRRLRGIRRCASQDILAERLPGE